MNKVVKCTDTSKYRCRIVFHPSQLHDVIFLVIHPRTRWYPMFDLDSLCDKCLLERGQASAGKFSSSVVHVTASSTSLTTKMAEACSHSKTLQPNEAMRGR
jgi:hypothetical protein